MPRPKKIDSDHRIKRTAKVSQYNAKEDASTYVAEVLRVNLDIIVEQLLNLVVKGNERAVFYAMDRILGKPVDQSVMSINSNEKKTIVTYVNDWRKKQLATDEELDGMRIGKQIEEVKGIVVNAT